MKKKKDPRGRKPKFHKTIPATFDDVLGAISRSKYKDKKSLQKNKTATK